MAMLTIRNFDATVEGPLRVRASRNGRSVEAEARAILSETIASVPREAVDLAEAIRRCFAPLGEAELDLHPPVEITKRCTLRSERRFDLQR
jgi:plasmid stability protein